jgi:hypothetical protein
LIFYLRSIDTTPNLPMTKGFEYQLTNKAKTFITFLQLLHSDTDCVLHLYKVLKDVEEEENKNDHSNRLLLRLFQKGELPRWTLNSFPIDRNITEWGIKIYSRESEHADHLEMIKMIGGSSKYCDATYYRFIMNIKQQDWINDTLLMESNGATILVKEEPPPPSLKDKIKTLNYKVDVDGSDEFLYEQFGTYGSLSMRASDLAINPLRISRFLGSYIVVEVETIRYNSTEHHYGRYM